MKMTVEQKKVKIKNYKKSIIKEVNGTTKDLKISLGNKKCKVPYFSQTPLGTCGPDKDCFEFCYAAKAFLAYPTVRRRHVKNELAANSSNFVELISSEIKTKVKGNVFRVHESGEFTNNAYIQKWYTVMAKFPKITFYAYSTRQDLDFKSNKPKNFVLNYSSSSVFDSKFKLKKKGFDNLTQVIATKSKSKKKEMICLGGVNSKIKCGTTCNICFTKTKSMKVINFIKH